MSHSKIQKGIFLLFSAIILTACSSSVTVKESAAPLPEKPVMIENLAPKKEGDIHEVETQEGSAQEASESGYHEYSEDAFQEALGERPIALFFHAKWCPSCVGLNKEIEQDPAKIPGGAVIFKIDYDTSAELKKQYGVTVQHTLVFFDRAGNKTEKLTGPSFTTIISKLSK